MVKVICRIKPPLYGNTKITDDNNLLFLKKEDSLLEKNKIIYKKYKLDKFYDTNTNNYTIYKEQIKPIMDESFYLFLYGHTGSGKTYTIFGNQHIDGLLDIIFRNINYTAKIEAMELSSIGCVDIFNDKIVTLLENDNKIKLFNITHKEVSSEKEFDKVINNIKNKRKTGTSKYNSYSSRTHLIINIYHNKKKYVIIDLAGHERKPEMKKGSSYIDTNYINSSLLALKECFRKSNEKNAYIPYRRSKLTRLLKIIFETNVKSLIISTIHSGYQYQNDTYDTLSYVSQFKKSIDNNFIIKKNYSDYLLPHSKYISKKPISLDKLDHIPKIRPKSSPTSISMDKKELFPLQNKKISVSKKIDPFSNKYLNDKKLNDKKYDPFKYYDDKYKYKYKNDKYSIYSDDYYKNKYNKLLKKDTDSKYKNEISNLKKNNVINDFENINYDNDENLDEYDIIDETKNKKIKIDNLKDYGIYTSKKLNKNGYKIMKSINHIIYTRSIKNYVKLINNQDDEDKLLEVLNGTIATIEIVLSELHKIYH